MLKAIFASSSSNRKDVSLSAPKESGVSKPKKVTGTLIAKKSRGVKKPQGKNSLKKKKKFAKNSKGKSVAVVKENKPMLLIEMLPKKVVKLVIDYFIDVNLYYILVSTRRWTFEALNGIAVDSAGVYILTCSEGLKGLSHPLANIKEDECRLTEFGGSQWSEYDRLGSSHDGRCISFNHLDETLIDSRGQPKRCTKWFTQGNDPEGRRFKRVTFDGEDSKWGVLSRDGQTLCSYSSSTNLITRVYRLRAEAGKDPIGLMKFKLNGEVRAVSGSGNCVIVENWKQFEIHNTGKDASKLVCQIDVPGFGYRCALNEDGSEAAFVNNNGELRIMDNFGGSAMEQPAIVNVKVPELVGRNNRLVHDDGGKLHVFHARGKVSLFGPSTKELILVEAPQEGQKVVDSAISPNADYLAFLRYVGEGENGKTIYETIVKQKLSAYLERLFGYKANKKKQAAKP